MARFIMAGQLQAIAFVVIMATISAIPFPLTMIPASILTGAAIALVTMRINWQKGLLLALIASGVQGALYAGQMNAAITVGVAMLQWTPIVLVAWLLYRTISWKFALQGILAIFAAAILILHLLVPDTTALWNRWLTELVAPLMSNPDISKLGLEQQIEQIAPWMTAIVVALSALILAGSLLVGRFWQAKLYNPGGFGEEFREIRLGKELSLVMVALIAVAFLSSNIMATELLMLGMAIFTLQGLAVVHAMVKAGKFQPFVLVVMYIFMGLMTVQVMAMMATLAIIDNFIDLRSKLNLP